MEILIVEDDPRMAALLVRGLEREGHVTLRARDGEEGLDFALSRVFDAIVLDVMLPGLDGLELARRLRAQGSTTPVLMLTAKDTTKDVVAGLDTGADDYLTKPFSFEELLARLRSLARRGPVSRPPRLRVANLTLDPASREVRRGGRPVSLTPREFRLLEFLMRRPGTVVSRDSLIEGCWGHDSDVEANTVDVFIGGLRRKIDTSGEVPMLRTVRGVGFVLQGDDG